MPPITVTASMTSLAGGYVAGPARAGRDGRRVRLGRPSRCVHPVGASPQMGTNQSATSALRSACSRCEEKVMAAGANVHTVT